MTSKRSIKPGLFIPPAPVILGRPASLVAPPILPGEAKILFLDRIELGRVRHAFVALQVSSYVVEPCLLGAGQCLHSVWMLSRHVLRFTGIQLDIV